MLLAWPEGQEPGPTSPVPWLLYFSGRQKVSLLSLWHGSGAGGGVVPGREA